MKIKYTTEEYVAKCKDKHEDAYDYSKTIYTGTVNKLTVTCRLHGDFSLTANSHLNGTGCYSCGIIKRAKSHRAINEEIAKITSTKVCNRCSVEKDINEFSPSKTLLHGVSSTCKDCNNLRVSRIRLLRRQLPRYITHKLCNKCKQCLPISQFGGLRVKRISPSCTKCRVDYARSPEQIDNTRMNKEKNKIKHAKKYKELSDERNKSPAPSKLFIHKMIIEDKPEDRNGLLFISCKKCEKMFNPSITQTYNRIHGITNPDGRQGSFYCSDYCKDTCDVFNRKTRRKSEVDHVSNKARTCQAAIRKELLKTQCDTIGYRFCERCGDIFDVELHHTNQVKHKEDINNSSGMILLCFSCHRKIHSECS